MEPLVSDGFRPAVRLFDDSHSINGIQVFADGIYMRDLTENELDLFVEYTLVYNKIRKLEMIAVKRAAVIPYNLNGGRFGGPIGKKCFEKPHEAPPATRESGWTPMSTRNRRSQHTTSIVLPPLMPLGLVPMVPSSLLDSLWFVTTFPFPFMFMFLILHLV